MIITMKEEGTRFGVRAGAIIYNEDRKKFYQKIKEGFIDFQKAIERELKEELNLRADLKLKYIVEMFLNSMRIKYHEIGFYFITQINEDSILNKSKSLDGDSDFEWILISDLDNYNIIAKPIKEKVISNEICNDDLEHFIYSVNFQTKCRFMK